MQEESRHVVSYMETPRFFIFSPSVFQVSDLSQSREQARKEVKEKEEERQQMKEGLRAALEEMTRLKLLLQVHHLLLVMEDGSQFLIGVEGALRRHEDKHCPGLPY